MIPYTFDTKEYKSFLNKTLLRFIRNIFVCTHATSFVFAGFGNYTIGRKRIHNHFKLWLQFNFVPFDINDFIVAFFRKSVRYYINACSSYFHAFFTYGYLDPENRKIYQRCKYKIYRISNIRALEYKLQPL